MSNRQIYILNYHIVLMSLGGKKISKMYTYVFIIIARTKRTHAIKLLSSSLHQFSSPLFTHTPQYMISNIIFCVRIKINSYLVYSRICTLYKYLLMINKAQCFIKFSFFFLHNSDYNDQLLTSWITMNTVCFAKKIHQTYKIILNVWKCKKTMSKSDLISNQTPISWGPTPRVQRPHFVWVSGP